MPGVMIAGIGSNRLTQEDINKLPLDLKICYNIQPWDKSMNPKTVDEWARQVGFMSEMIPQGYHNPIDKNICILKAKENVKRWIKFINSIVNDEIDNIVNDLILINKERRNQNEKN